MLVLVDNYDSFVFNLARYLRRLGQTTHVVRNDAIDAKALRAMQPEAIVFSPGPCTPSESGNALDIIRRLHTEVPMLGICLGHQAIGAALGGRVIRASEPVHGRASEVFHSGRGLLAGLPSPFAACRYHSLIVAREGLPAELEVTAWTADGTVMAIAHRELPVVGLQFHPEAILTEHGYRMLSGFLKMAGITVPAVLPEPTSERADALPVAPPLPREPVTF